MININELAAIEKLKLPAEETGLLEPWTEQLTESFRALADVDAEGIQPLVTVLDLHNVLREDQSFKMITRAELLSNAPEQYEGHFQVPKTLD